MKIYGCHFKILIINLIYYLILCYFLLTANGRLQFFHYSFFPSHHFLYIFSSISKGRVCVCVMWYCCWSTFTYIHIGFFSETSIIVSIILFILFEIFLWIFIFNFDMGGGESDGEGEDRMRDMKRMKEIERQKV